MARDFFGTSPLIEDAWASIRLRKFWLISLIFVAVYGVGSLVSTTILIIPTLIWVFTDPELQQAIASGEPTMDLSTTMPDWLTLLSLYITVASIVTVLLYCLLLEKRSAFSLGFHKKGAVTEYLAGLGIGLLMFGAVFGIMLVSGEVTDVHFNPELSVVMLVLFFLGFVVQGASEEILLRSFYFVSGSASASIPLAMVVSSALFAALHLGNPGITFWSLVNLFLFGVFAALYFLRRGSIWGIAAIHTVWNFAQGNIFGCKVSGMEVETSVLVSSASESKTWFSGGSFGPEGGLGVTIVLIVGIVILLFMKNKQRVRGE